jgi:hypothetical protein
MLRRYFQNIFAAFSFCASVVARSIRSCGSGNRLAIEKTLEREARGLAGISIMTAVMKIIFYS